ncbi:hypothetical protein L914_12766, partial [Phytophthora nicotianae]
AIDQTEALCELRQDHEVLRREFLSTRRRVEDLDRQLADAAEAASPCCSSASLALELRELATSHNSAQAEVARLEAVVERKTRRFRALREGYERLLNVAYNTIAAHSAELIRLQGRFSTLDQDVRRASQRVRAAITQRDQARAERSATQDRVSAARDTIARLEKRINQVEKSQKSRQLETTLAILRQERDSMVV